MANVIEIVITGDEKGYTAAIKNAQGATDRLAQDQKNAAEAGHAAFQKMEGGVLKTHTALHPLKTALVDLTGATGSFGAAVFNLVRFGFTPLGLVLSGTVAATTALISKWMSQESEAAALAKALQEQSNQLSKLNLEYRVMTKSVSEASAASQNLRTIQNQQLDELAARIEKIKSVNAALIPGLGSATQGILSIFDLSAADQKRLEAELSARRGLVEAQARATGRNILTAEAEKSAQAEEGLRNQIVETQIELLKLTHGEEAAAKATIEQAEAVALQQIAHDKLNPAIAVTVRQLAEEKLHVLEATTAWKARQEIVQLMLASLEAENAVENEIRDIQDKQLTAAIEKTKTLMELEADRLQLLGQTREAEELRLRAQIEALNKSRETIQGVQNQDVIDKQVQLQEERMRHLGEVTVNVGNEITRAVTDIFSAAINGTLKLSDIGKAGLLAVGRTVTEFFSQVLSKKLGFEQLIFSNLRGFPQQANAALAAGGASVSGAAGGVGGGGGGAAGGGGGLFGSIASSIGGFILPGLGGFGIGSLIGGTPGGIAGTIGGIGGALLQGTSLGASILGPIVGGLEAALPTSLVTGAIGTALGGLVGNFVLPGIGAILGGLFGKLFGGGKIKKPIFSVQTVLPASAPLTIESLLATQGNVFTVDNPSGGPGTNPSGPIDRIGIPAGGGFGIFAGGTPTARNSAMQELQAISGKIKDAFKPFEDILALAPAATRAAILATPFDPARTFHRDLDIKSTFIGPQAVNLIGGTAERDIGSATTKFFDDVFATLKESFLQQGLDVTDPQLMQRLQQQSEVQKQQTQEATQLQRIFDQASQSLEGQIAEQRLQLDMLGKSAEEAMKMRREFDLAKFASQGLNTEEIQSLRVLAEQSDEITRQFQARQQELAIAEQRRQQEEEITRRINERFLGLEGSLRSEVEQRRFDVMTFGLAPDEAAHARREFDLTRLGREGIGADQLDILRQLMSERDTLVQKLEELKTTVKESAAAGGPTHVDITINGDVSSEEDMREMARRVTAVLEGQISPSN